MQELVEKRKKKKLRQYQVAKMVGVSRQYYNSIENQRRVPKVETAKKIADVLDVEWTIFFTDRVNK
ncbi:helix-turn-helix transcriptional regulator [Paenibacillus dendritiformis]|uniref:helix-turn-helix transcriptional regulator n=1 Tax=Paenibacillus dendritiformis TaxID=130049 RepID=UPI000DA99034|nr:helix-turn-helix transcriptional regulator [Paenibacillus dendritiformis]PZM62572.1 XRE family transcriptional regulator [Paenibacillus dendritiformis]